MLNEFAKEWVAALRSGNYMQGKGYLNKQGNFCCLGVACEIAVKHNVIPSPIKLGEGLYRYGNETFIGSSSLPNVVRDWLGLNGSLGDFEGAHGHADLAAWNDAGISFGRIAELIESEPLRLFRS